MNAPRFRVFDPLRGQWAAPLPAFHAMTPEPCQAAHFATEAAATVRARELIGPARPWLVIEPAMPCGLCGTC